jgi:hypothetical protein
LDACEAGGDTPGLVVAGVFEGNPVYAESRQARQRKVEALGEAGAHDDAFGISGGPAYPAQVARQHLA